MAFPARTPLIVGLGGTVSAGSSTESALRIALDAAQEAGARVRMFDGPFLTRLPHYRSVAVGACAEAVPFLDAMREADGVVIASPGYHGSISGLVKNAVDYLEETARDTRPYLDGLPVGLIVTAYGWQATGSTLGALRAIVHSLRGWPTPLGATLNVAGGTFADGRCHDDAAARQLAMVGEQVVAFARMGVANPAITETMPE